MKQRYVYWQEEEMWLGYWEEYPGYRTQGETEVELGENLRDIYGELIERRMPAEWRLPVGEASIGSPAVPAISIGQH